MWRNQFQIDKAYTSEGFRTAFKSAYALSLLLENSISDITYKANGFPAESLVLSDAGLEVHRKVLSANTGASEEEIQFAILAYFYRQDLLIDCEKSKVRPIADFVSSEFSSGNLKLPWIFERALYDRFFEKFTAETNSLTFAQTKELLDGVEQGVFQLEFVIAGPFGLLRSKQARLLDCAESPMLWHCSDPSCNSRHRVKLTSSDNGWRRAYQSIDTHLKSDDTRFSEWGPFYRTIADRPDYFDRFYPAGIPSLIGDCLSINEIRYLLAAILKDGSTRSLLPTRANSKNLKGSPTELVEKLSKSECMQLVLLATDTEIISALEQSIQRSLICVPKTEIRTPKNVFGNNGAFGVVPECSTDGVRFHSPGISPHQHLYTTLMEVAADRPLAEKIAWRIRHNHGNSFAAKLRDYTLAEDPKTIVRDIVFLDRDVLKAVCGVLRYGDFDLALSKAAEDQLVDKILWKSGFDYPRYPTKPDEFWAIHAKFEKIVSETSSSNSEGRETIRSVGVNYFVSLEEFLENVISFGCWVLMSDHYSKTKFRLMPEEARVMWVNALNREGKKHKLKYDLKGRNTLYGLVAGLNLLPSYLRKQLRNKRESLRPKKELPTFADKTPAAIFPFRHRALLFDVNTDQLEIYFESLLAAHKKLEASSVVSVRNRLDHQREDFPSKEECLRASRTIQEVANSFEELGIYPLLYYKTTTEIDQFGRFTVTFKDYKHRGLKMGFPTPYIWCGLLDTNGPRILARWITLENTTVPFAFTTQENSEYVRLWSDYPRRRERI